MIISNSSSARHLSQLNMDQYIARRVPVLHPIEGSPQVWLFIEPTTREMGLRVGCSLEAQLPETRLEHVSARLAWSDGSRYLEVVINNPALFRDAYGPLCSMADRIQVDQLEPFEALRITLGNLNALLREVHAITPDREIALFGELITLRGILKEFEPSVAIDSWRGGEAEHDFGFSAVDIEVKTTSTERRQHWISSLTQLAPTESRPLWLISHQITVAGSESGARLPELIREVRMTVGEGADRDTLERTLRHAGWADRFSEDCVTRWARRGPSRAWAVAGGFPRLNPDMVVAAGGDLARLPDVRYRIDLTGLPQGPSLPSEIRAAVANEGG